MSRILATAMSEFRIAFRNRWVSIATGMMVLFALVLAAAGSAPTAMFLVRSGAVEIVDAGGDLIDHDEQGACFGQLSIIEERPSRFTFTALEDTLLWSFAPARRPELGALLLREAHELTRRTS